MGQRVSHKTRRQLSTLERSFVAAQYSRGGRGRAAERVVQDAAPRVALRLAAQAQHVHRGAAHVHLGPVRSVAVYRPAKEDDGRVARLQRDQRGRCHGQARRLEVPQRALDGCRPRERVAAALFVTTAAQYDKSSSIIKLDMRS